MGTGLLVGGVGALTSLCVGLIIYDSAASALEGALWPLINGVASAVLCVGTLPLWELAFDIQIFICSHISIKSRCLNQTSYP